MLVVHKHDRPEAYSEGKHKSSDQIIQVISIYLEKFDYKRNLTLLR